MTYIPPINSCAVFFYDKNKKPLTENDVCKDLTEFYTLKAKQEECGKTGHDWYHHLKPAKSISGFEHDYKICTKCGLAQT